MQGILIVDKPMEWTSFDVIAKLRGILGTRKLGHSGTLDPMATGGLPGFCGGASKAVDLQLEHTKPYCARRKLGLRTDTGDITGTDPVVEFHAYLSPSKKFDTLDELRECIDHAAKRAPEYFAE